MLPILRALGFFVVISCRFCGERRLSRSHVLKEIPPWNSRRLPAAFAASASRSRWSTGKVDCSADQLLIYHELAKPLAGGKSLRLEFAVLTKTQQPAVELYDIAPAPQRLDRMRRAVARIWRALEAGH